MQTIAKNIEADNIEALENASDEAHESAGSQWVRERARIAAGKGKGTRFAALAQCFVDKATQGDAAVVSFAQANELCGLSRKVGPEGVASWRTLLQRAKQTELASSGVFAGWRIDAERGAFVYKAPTIDA